MSSLRIALLCPLAADPVRDLAAGLAARGHHPWLITSRRGRHLISLDAGVAVTSNRHPPERRLERRGFETPISHVPGTYLSLRHGSADLAHAFHVPDGAVAANWSTSRGRPSVFSFAGVPERSWLVARRLRLECVLRALRGCDAVVTSNLLAAEALRTSLGIQARVIHPGINLQGFWPGGERSDAPTIVAAGQDGVADVGVLTETLSHLRRSRAGVSVLDPSPAAYRRAWLTVLLSHRDGCERPLVESLACGTPVLALAGGANPEVVDRPEIGLLLRSTEPAEVARAILDGFERVSDPGTVAACTRRAQAYSVPRSAAAHEALYLELLAARS